MARTCPNQPVEAVKAEDQFKFCNFGLSHMNTRAVASCPVRPGSVPQDEILLDAAEVAQILRVPRSWVYSHLAELPVIRLGRYVRFRRAEIEHFLEQRTTSCQ
jgi:excisionase family DNA binding protein